MASPQVIRLTRENAILRNLRCNMNIDEAFRALVWGIQKKQESDESDAESKKKHRKRHHGECAVLRTK